MPPTDRMGRGGERAFSPGRVRTEPPHAILHHEEVSLALGHLHRVHLHVPVSEVAPRPEKMSSVGSKGHRPVVGHCNDGTERRESRAAIPGDPIDERNLVRLEIPHEAPGTRLLVSSRHSRPACQRHDGRPLTYTLTHGA